MSIPGPSNDSTCLVTGASSGIGAEIAREFARRGYNVTLAARRAERLRGLAKELADEYGVEATPVQCDVTDDEQVREMLVTLEREGKTIDVLVNNAGAGSEGGFADCSYESQVGQIDLNCRAVVGLTHQVIGGMIERGAGGVLIVASTAAFQPMPRQCVYAATKAFVLSFSEALSREVARDGVAVTALCPGPTKTEFFGNNMERYIQSTPSFAWQSADAVARAGVEGLMRGKRVVIPSVLNRVSAASGAYTPHSVSLRMIDRFWPVGKG
jgi:short-subunit dehydrogenase